MQLPGRLEVTTLGDVLGALYRERASGVLELLERGTSHSGRPHRLYIELGLVRDVDSPLSVAKLGELLFREGFLDGGTWQELSHALLFEPSQKVGQLLIEKRWASADVVRAALRHQLRRRLDAVFCLQDADLRFHVAQPRRDAESPALAPEEFLHGRARARCREAQSKPRHAAPASGPRAGAPPPNPDRHRARARATEADMGNKQRKDPVRQAALRTLGLAAEADCASVQRAFRKLARDVHPDRFPEATADQRTELLREFVRLSSAYHALVG